MRPSYARAVRTVACGLILTASVWGQAKDHVRKMQERFIAPCCWSEPVAVHRSEIAATMRTEIERMVKEGKTEQQIEARFVAEYGERILMEPRGQTQWWLMVIPVVGIALGLWWLWRYVERRRQSEPARAAAPAVEVKDEELEW